VKRRRGASGHAFVTRRPLHRGANWCGVPARTCHPTDAHETARPDAAPLARRPSRPGAGDPRAASGRRDPGRRTRRGAREPAGRGTRGRERFRGAGSAPGAADGPVGHRRAAPPAKRRGPGYARSHLAALRVPAHGVLRHPGGRQGAGLRRQERRFPDGQRAHRRRGHPRAHASGRERGRRGGSPRRAQLFPGRRRGPPARCLRRIHRLFRFQGGRRPVRAALRRRRAHVEHGARLRRPGRGESVCCCPPATSTSPKGTKGRA
jgi:hypothetical protein